MTKYTTPNAKRPAQGFAPAPAAVTAGGPPVSAVDDYSQMAEGLNIEFVTVPGFIRRIPHRWHMDDIRRFGDNVGRMAEALQLSYMTTVDLSLGMVRVFPVALLRRVYELLAPTFGWPKIIEAETAIDDTAKAEAILRANERAERQLASLRERVDDVATLEHIEGLQRFLEAETERLREQLAAPAANAGALSPAA